MNNDNFYPAPTIETVEPEIVTRSPFILGNTKEIGLNELSERVGIANVNLSKLKNGHVSAIRFSTLIAICEALHCQPGDLREYAEDQ